MKYFLVVGERSGDLHASNLARSIRSEDPEADLVAYGGGYLAGAGVRILKHYEDYSFMGFSEVLANIFRFREIFKKCCNDIRNFNPDVVILVDFAGFNLRLAKFCKKHGVRTAYYISPKIWAWNKRRIQKIKAYVDKMYVIFPFEEEFYRNENHEVFYVGNPLVQYVDNYKLAKLEISSEFNAIVAMFPGSRAQEINKMLKDFRKIIVQKPDFFFLIAGVDNVDPDCYGSVEGLANAQVHYDRNYEILSESDAAVITSGTATLEAALWDVPQVVCYKTSHLSYHIAKLLIRVKFISLVNIIANREVVKELIQKDFNAGSVERELEKLLFDKTYQSDMVKAYGKIRHLLGDQKAPEVTARYITDWLH